MILVERARYQYIWLNVVDMLRHFLWWVVVSSLQCCWWTSRRKKNNPITLSSDLSINVKTMPPMSSNYVIPPVAYVHIYRAKIIAEKQLLFCFITSASLTFLRYINEPLHDNFCVYVYTVFTSERQCIIVVLLHYP